MVEILSFNELVERQRGLIDNSAELVKMTAGLAPEPQRRIKGLLFAEGPIVSAALAEAGVEPDSVVYRKGYESSKEQMLGWRALCLPHWPGPDEPEPITLLVNKAGQVVYGFDEETRVSVDDREVSRFSGDRLFQPSGRLFPHIPRAVRLRLRQPLGLNLGRGALVNAMLRNGVDLSIPVNVQGPDASAG